MRTITLEINLVCSPIHQLLFDGKTTSLKELVLTWALSGFRVLTKLAPESVIGRSAQLTDVPVITLLGMRRSDYNDSFPCH